VNQRFDYSSNPAQNFGAQSVEVGLLSRWRLPHEFALRTHAFGDAIFLGAIDAPRAGVGERIYDFGPGAGVRLQADLERRGITYVSMVVRSEFLHTTSGATANHIADFGGLELNIPVAYGVGLGVHSAYYARKSVYRDGTRNRHDFPELRLYLNWTAAGRPQSGPGNR
jgi:hypothetical protein